MFGQAANLTLNTAQLAANDKKRSPLTPKSPILPQPESKSPGSTSQKTPTTLSRQGTLRASHRRKNSMTGSLVLVQGRRSPVGFNDRSPQGRRSPLIMSNDRLKSPNELPVQPMFGLGLHSPTARSPTGGARSPTLSMHTQERRSPIGAAAPVEFGQPRRSPTSTVHVQDAHYEEGEADENGLVRSSSGIKRPSINLFTPIYFGGDKRSPLTAMPIPPITVSNPTETGRLAEKIAESNAAAEAARELERQREEQEKQEAAAAAKESTPEKKERTSVMKEILAFVRKPSKHISTRTNRFAHAFTRAESGSSSGPLIRQSTFSASPAASSTAAKSAVVKQMSEVAFEPKMSLKFAHYAKMSLKLRRSANDDKAKQAAAASTSKRASADSNFSSSGLDPHDAQVGRAGGSLGGGAGSGRASPLGELPFELANVHFEKVGESYIKHEKIHEEEFVDEAGTTTDTIVTSLVEEITNSLKVVSLSSENAQITHHFQRRSESREPIEPRISEERESDSNDLVIPEDFRTELTEILKSYASEPIYVNLQVLRRETEEAEAAAAQALAKATENSLATEKSPLQCPIIEFEPPSRRSSFDPPRSPFLENLRSPGADTDNDLINLQRLDSGGDSFEMVEGDRKSSRAESSFDCPYSSRDTSFDISRYQSTSYEDQTSSFEIVDMDDKKKSNIDLRKSSIELVDAETFQRSGYSCGRKSSLETHFDYTPSDASGMTPARSPNFPVNKKQKPETLRALRISPFSAFSRARSPLSNQTSSNYSSRDSYDSSSSYPHSAPSHHEPQRSPFADPTKKHFPLTIKQREEEVKTFLCTDQRCASIFEPRPSSVLTQQLSTGSMSTPSGYGNGTPCPVVGSVAAGFSSGSEFEPPSPRRAASASPKHTFTFRIVMKKVDSSPEALCTERHRSRIFDRYRRRDSRRKRIHEAGKSF